MDGRAPAAVGAVGSACCSVGTGSRGTAPTDGGAGATFAAWPLNDGAPPGAADRSKAAGRSGIPWVSATYGAVSTGATTRGSPGLGLTVRAAGAGPAGRPPSGPGGRPWRPRGLTVGGGGGRGAPRGAGGRKGLRGGPPRGGAGG